MRTLLLIPILLIVLVAPAWADFDDGLAAYERRDYATALREFKHLAEQGDARAQARLGNMYVEGKGVSRNDAEAVKWYRKAAEQGNARGQAGLGFMYGTGRGTPQDYAGAVKWSRMAAQQGNARGQSNLGYAYRTGLGVPQDEAEAARWTRKAAQQGYAPAQLRLGVMYLNGHGVPQDYVLAYMWSNLAAARGSGSSRASGRQGKELASANRDLAANRMTPGQIAEAQRLARKWETRFASRSEEPQSRQPSLPRPSTRLGKEIEKHSTGSGFVVSRNGHVLTNHHVVEECRELRIPPYGAVRLVGDDPGNDLALLRTPNRSSKSASFRDGRGIRPGDTVIVAGFPLQGVLTSDLNITSGNVSALAGPRDDRRILQITAPVQQGNSGGPLLDLSGNVVGVVVAKLSALKIALVTGDIPQNVNFAISAGIARNFLDAHSIPYETALSEQTLAPADVAARAREFTVLVECWK